MKYFVTIAIPLYNAGKYINETMESALNQTFQEIEFLIINDRGTDDSVKMIRQLQENHLRGKDIRIVSHDHNLGVAAARNTAINKAQGDYLFFLDSDDLITPDCIEILYKTATKEKAELTYASYREEWENKKKCGTDFILSDMRFDGEDQLAQFANQNLYRTLRSFTWNVLYDLSFLRSTHVKFQSVTIWEDLLFYYDLIPLVKKAVLIKDITYIYIKREGSLSNYQPRTEIPREEIREHIQIREYCKERCKQLTGKPYFDNLVTKTMKLCVDTAAVAIEKRKMFVPRLETSEIKKLLKHPLSYSDIRKLKNYRTFNTLTYILNLLPGWMITFLLATYIRTLKTYRKHKN
ncbi:glycosyltransferase family 2 protein [Bacteroides faecalis]|uniref:Glycosyltransferase 2-like domain-containing protein n=1 Tax=Bacteroides faecalis TaxID=2447885 RepID=A0A401LS89_9BACE|nr:glycosyltransferase family 2 protein [Bacteroides faecalis]GCB34428.1 hypothetical protein KGMB02408_13730 [Bacteroides faecalis]